MALAKAGADVYHAGKIGTDGQWVIDKLQGYGVGTDFIQSCDSASGHAIIQVDSDGRNAIVLYPGCNKMFTRREIDMTLGNFATDSILLLQNEINEVPYLIQEAHKRGMEVCLNPAPFDMAVRNYPLTEVDILIVNEIESMELAGVTKITEALEYLEKILPDTEIVITLGEKGATYLYRGNRTNAPAFSVDVVDTTAAGDTFIGYFVAARARKEPIDKCLKIASKAASLCKGR